MALTIIEAAKLNSGDVVRQAIVEMYARNSDILRVLPFDDIPGNAMKYNREDVLPGVGFRGVNEACAESIFVLNPTTDFLAIAGDDLDLDHFIIQTMGTSQRSAQEGLKVKALAYRWTLALIKDDSSANLPELDDLWQHDFLDVCLPVCPIQSSILTLGSLQRNSISPCSPSIRFMLKVNRR